MPDYFAIGKRKPASLRRHRFGRTELGACSRRQGALVRIKETTLNPEKPGDFLAWLDGALALESLVAAQPENRKDRIRRRLGRVPRRRARVPRPLGAVEVRTGRSSLKRQLWAQLLKIVYGHDIETDAFWLQHTYLVVVAKCIAFAVLGMNEDDPGRLLAGRRSAPASPERSRAIFRLGRRRPRRRQARAPDHGPCPTLPAR